MILSIREPTRHSWIQVYSAEFTATDVTYTIMGAEHAPVEVIVPFNSSWTYTLLTDEGNAMFEIIQP